MENANDATQNWGWWIGDDHEHYSSGPHATREDAIRTAKNDKMGYCGEGKTVAFCLVEAQSGPIDFAPLFDARDWLDWVDENQLCDLWGEDESKLDELSEDDISSLQKHVFSAIQMWQVGRKVQIVPYIFSNSRNTEFLIVPAE